MRETFLIKVVSCGSPDYWYNDQIGKYFYVCMSCSVFDYSWVSGELPVLDINPISGRQPLFMKDDCIIVSELEPVKMVKSLKFNS